jgi:hypothetical protein
VSNLEEIERAIAGLPRQEFFQLVQDLRARHAELWDRQIEEDAENGKLQELYDSLTAKDSSDSSIPLNDFLTDQKLS